MTRTLAALTAIVALAGLTGCRPPLILNNSTPHHEKKIEPPKGPSPIRCVQAPCP